MEMTPKEVVGCQKWFKRGLSMASSPCGPLNAPTSEGVPFGDEQKNQAWFVKHLVNSFTSRIQS